MPNPDLATKTQRINLIYIIGNGHSGSTLLCLLLGANQHIFAGGHLRQYKRLYNEQDTLLTSKGVPVKESPLWNNVKYLLHERNQVPDIHLHHPAFDAQEMMHVYRAILDTTGDTAICDNSMNLNQLEMLLALPIDTFIAHIVRDGRAVQHSMIRKYKGYKNWPAWKNYNLQIWRQYAGQKNYTCVRYEDLVQHPRERTLRILERVADYFGDDTLRTLPEDEELYRFENDMFSANRMRFKRNQTISPDFEYLRAISPAQWVRLTMFMYPALMRFGYPLRRRFPDNEPW
jgi:hypothetical protein